MKKEDLLINVSFVLTADMYELMNDLCTTLDTNKDDLINLLISLGGMTLRKELKK